MRFGNAENNAKFIVTSGIEQKGLFYDRIETLSTSLMLDSSMGGGVVKEFEVGFVEFWLALNMCTNEGLD